MGAQKNVAAQRGLVLLSTSGKKCPEYFSFEDEVKEKWSYLSNKYMKMQQKDGFLFRLAMLPSSVHQ